MAEIIDFNTKAKIAPTLEEAQKAMQIIEDTDVKIILETIAGSRNDYPVEMAKTYYHNYLEAQKVVEAYRKAHRDEIMTMISGNAD